MADSRQSSGRTFPAVGDAHRLDDLNYGHLGRLTYLPADTDGEEPGNLHTTRGTELVPHFQQITPFERLAPPALMSPASVSPAPEPWRAARFQRNWLLSRYPEALCGNPDLISSLRREIRGPEPARPERLTGPLIALGEVADRSRENTSSGRPAIAFAAGEAGHVLQLSTLTRDERRWDDEKLAVHLSTTSSGERGEWAEGGLPISVIKFAIDTKKNNYIRWVLVQKETSTTILAPEIRKRPIRRRHLRSDEPQGTFQISPNPLLTITSDKTGGGSQSDVSFNPSSSSEPPQLAIINTYRYWSIWDITKTHTYAGVLRACGNIDLGAIPTLPRLGQGPKTSCRILWTSPPDGASSSRARAESVSEYSQDHDDPGRPSRLLRRARRILLCDDTTISSFEAPRGKLEPGLTVANPNRGERIFDVRRCPLDASQAFVLTSTTLLWVGYESAPAGGARLAVLISCPHHRKADVGGLRLSVSPETSFSYAIACFVCVYSAADAWATAFWFVKPSQGSPAQAYFRPISLDGPSGLGCVTISPLPSLYTQKDAVSSDGEPSQLRQAQLFQLFVQGSDLSLGSACIAWLPFPFHWIPPPRVVSSHRQLHDQRRNLLRYLQDSFVVPDDLEDDDAPAAEAQTTHPASEEGPIKRERAKKKTVNFALLGSRLQSSVGNDALGVSAAEPPPADTPFSAIRELVEQSMAENRPSIHFLSEVPLVPKVPTRPDHLQREWTAQVADLQALGPVSVVERHAYGFHPDSRRLAESIREQAMLPADAPEALHREQQRIIDGATADVYFSLLGVSTTPQPAGLLDTEDVKAEPEAEDEAEYDPTIPDRAFPESPGSSIASQSDRQRSSSLGLESVGTQDGGDGAISRLQRYLPTLAKPSGRQGGGAQLRLLSNWPEELGTDARDYSWVPAEQEKEEETLRRRRQQKESSARRRRAEKRRLSGLMPLDAVGEPSSQPLAPPSSSLPGPGFFSSQPRDAMLPQSQSSIPVFSSQVMSSQAAPGPFGSQTPRTKMKAKRGRRTSGFR